MSSDGSLLLDADYYYRDNLNYLHMTTTLITLAQGERIIGMKSYRENTYGEQHNL